MLQQMRSLAKYIWVLVALVFVGGFLLYQTSGLMGRTPVTNTTAVAVVNGHEILYSDFTAQVQRQIQAEQQRQQGQSLSQDDDRRIENSVFDQLVGDVLLQDEYRRRGITVSDDEIREFARFAPPPWIQNAPELQTEGRFDPDKYQRLLASPVAREQGLLLELEAYYRSEIPREKLYDEIAAGVYVTDEELWRMWQDQRDSAQVSYVAFHPADVAAVGKSLSDADLKAYFDKHAQEFDRPGRAVLSVAVIPKVITAQDSALAKAHADSLRNAILKGAKFEDVAKSESADTLSGQKGGDLGRGGRGRFVAEFEKAAYALKPGEISQPVLTQFGYHLIRVDSRKGDTLSLRHILIRIQASEANATATDKKADELSKLAASSDQPKKLDSAAAKLGLSIYSVVAFENEPATLSGRPVPGASAWAFGGSRPGETSELFDDDNGYYLARLDSLDQGGTPKFDAVKEEVRAKLAEQRALEQLVPTAKSFAENAAKTSLDAAAAPQKLKVEHTPLFSRASFVPGLGQLTAAIGAAFSLNPGQVSQPVSTDDGVYVLRVDKRIRADSAAWVSQKATQKQQRLQAMRQQAIEMFLEDMRKSAKVVDHRKDINAALRRQSA